MSILNDFSKRKAQDGNIADAVVIAQQACAETAIVCSAFGLNQERQSLSKAERSLDMLLAELPENSSIHGIGNASREEVWLHGIEACKQVAQHCIDVGNNSVAEELGAVINIFEQMPQKQQEAWAAQKTEIKPKRKR